METYTLEQIEDFAEDYLWGENGLPKDGVKSLYFTKMGAEMGSAYCQRLLGINYIHADTAKRHGVPIEKDLDKGEFWLNKAAENGDKEAKRKLARFYLEGKVLKAQYAKSARLYHELADLGDLDGRRMWGVCLYNGYGVTKNKEQGLKELEEAAKNGSKEASLFYQEMTVRKEEYRRKAKIFLIISIIHIPVSIFLYQYTHAQPDLISFSFLEGSSILISFLLTLLLHMYVYAPIFFASWDISYIDKLKDEKSWRIIRRVLLIFCYVVPTIILWVTNGIWGGIAALIIVRMLIVLFRGNTKFKFKYSDTGNDTDKEVPCAICGSSDTYIISEEHEKLSEGCTVLCSDCGCSTSYNWRWS